MLGLLPVVRIVDCTSFEGCRPTSHVSILGSLLVLPARLKLSLRALGSVRSMPRFQPTPPNSTTSKTDSQLRQPEC